MTCRHFAIMARIIGQQNFIVTQLATSLSLRPGLFVNIRFQAKQCSMGLSAGEPRLFRPWRTGERPWVWISIPRQSKLLGHVLPRFFQLLLIRRFSVSNDVLSVPIHQRSIFHRTLAGGSGNDGFRNGPIRHFRNCVASFSRILEAMCAGSCSSQPLAG